jgi:hypothetical protein
VPLLCRRKLGRPLCQLGNWHWQPITDLTQQSGHHWLAWIVSGVRESLCQLSGAWCNQTLVDRQFSPCYDSVMTGCAGRSRLCWNRRMPVGTRIHPTSLPSASRRKIGWESSERTARRARVGLPLELPGHAWEPILVDCDRRRAHRQRLAQRRAARYISLGSRPDVSLRNGRNGRCGVAGCWPSVTTFHDVLRPSARVEDAVRGHSRSTRATAP